MIIYSANNRFVIKLTQLNFYYVAMRVVIVIPLYKQNPKREELASLIQCAKILNNYDICFVTYKELNFSNYKELDNYKKDYQFAYFDKENFSSIESYSKLCLSCDFYKKFDNYDFMFLYQLDGWVFKDELNYWCKQDYDYIGAPWFEGHDSANENSQLVDPSGNGGVSLRRIHKFIKILQNKRKIDNTRIISLAKCRKRYKGFLKPIRKYLDKSNKIKYNKNMNEDYIIVECFNTIDKSFKIAPAEIALKFSFEVFPERLYGMNNNTLPFACHAWEKYNKKFYKDFISF